jgi:hypothetical protein
MGKPIWIKMTGTGNGSPDSVIPNGIKETLQIEVFDGYASFKFVDDKTTRKFAQSQKKSEFETKYIERLQKAVVKYPNMSQTAILSHIQGHFKGQGHDIQWKV